VYRRMSFGLHNASVIFQRCMLTMLFDYVEQIMKVFMDKFLVYGGIFDLCFGQFDEGPPQL